MRRVRGGLRWWAASAVLALAAGACSTDNVGPEPFQAPQVVRPTLATGSLPPAPGSTTVTINSNSSIQFCGFNPTLTGAPFPNGTCSNSFDLTAALAGSPGDPGWGAPLAGTSWIGAQANANEYRVLPGAYAFQTTFEVPAGSTDRLLNISIKADNWAIIYLNGTEIGRHSPQADASGNWLSAQAFNDQASFVTGTNTLRIVLTNARVQDVAVGVPCAPPPGAFNFAGWDPLVCLNPSSMSFVATVSFVPAQVVPLFVIGDVNDHAVGDQVNFWGAQWWKNNEMSGFVSNGVAAFKGFAVLTSGSCGGTWATAPGNSSDPPETIPDVVGIIVTSTVLKEGADISGDIVQIVLVEHDGGYNDNPGHEGNGTVTSVVCTAP